MELANIPASKLKPAPTPFLPDEDKEDFEDSESGGELAPHASKILMKILYAARICRLELLKAVNYLSSRVTKWSKRCDARLFRLICYINGTKDHGLVGWIGDAAKDLYLGVWSDADFAGCKITMRSTSGSFLAILGPNSFFPLTGYSRKQTAVSHSTPEAELVAASAALKGEALPGLDLWEKLLCRRVVCNFYEDNQAAIQLLRSGKNPSMKHANRTHKISFMSIHETMMNDPKYLRLFYCDTNDMCADIFTKAFTNPDKWDHARRLIGVYKPGECNQFSRSQPLDKDHRKIGAPKDDPDGTQQAAQAKANASTSAKKKGKPKPQYKK